MNLEAVWHDLECGEYREDLALWLELADRAGGPVLDVGAGTGRVTLELAARGVDVVAIDVAEPLLGALAVRAGICRSRRCSRTRGSSPWAGGSRWSSCRCKRSSCSEGGRAAPRSYAARWRTSSVAVSSPPPSPMRWTASTKPMTWRRRPTLARSSARATRASC